MSQADWTYNIRSGPGWSFFINFQLSSGSCRMASFSFRNVVIDSMAASLPPNEVSSDAIEDRLAELYQRLEIPFGTLEKISGVKTRYFWDRDVLPSHAATWAAEKALEKSTVSRDQIGALVNCSVTRDYFEPAVASLVHSNLGINEQSITFDISNACIGFSDGLIMIANMIEAGQIKAGVVTTGEVITRVIDSCINHILSNKSIGRTELLKLLPTLTLGSAAVSYVLCHKEMAPEKPRLIGTLARSASEFSGLCIGNSDYAAAMATGFNPVMYTESQKLISSAAKLGGRTWEKAGPYFEWDKDDIDHIFCHQVGKQVNDAFYKEMGLDIAKEYTIYRRYGNPISAALPLALLLGADEKPLKRDEKVLLTAFGSGLNCRFIALEW